MCLMSIGLASTMFKMALSESVRKTQTSLDLDLFPSRLLVLCTKQKKGPRAAGGQTPKCKCFSAFCLHCICFCTFGQNKSHGHPDSRGGNIYSLPPQGNKKNMWLYFANYCSLFSSHNYSYSFHMQNMLSYIPGPPKLDPSNLGLFL